MSAPFSWFVMFPLPCSSFLNPVSHSAFVVSLHPSLYQLIFALEPKCQKHKWTAPRNFISLNFISQWASALWGSVGSVDLHWTHSCTYTLAGTLLWAGLDWVRHLSRPALRLLCVMSVTARSWQWQQCERAGDPCATSWGWEAARAITGMSPDSKGKVGDSTLCLFSERSCNGTWQWARVEEGGQNWRLGLSMQSFSPLSSPIIYVCMHLCIYAHRAHTYAYTHSYTHRAVDPGQLFFPPSYQRAFGKIWRHFGCQGIRW